MTSNSKEQHLHNETPLLDYWNKGGFILCIAGSAEIVINEQNFKLTRGCVFVITPLVQISVLRPTEDYRFVSFINELKLFYPVFRLIANTGIPIKVCERPCWQVSEEEISYIVTQAGRIRQKRLRIAGNILSDERTLLSHQIQLICHETMLEIVGNHIRNYPAHVDGIDKPETIAYRFLLALHENYQHERSVSWYASLANISAGHFTTLIRTATGKTPSEWIATVTITYAKLYLKQRDKNIKQIAAELNFPEQFTFRKYFKKHTGFSPREYRQLFPSEQ